MISSIATQTARFTPDPAQFISAFRDRLAALGRVHDHLRPGSRHYADLGELVREVLAPYTDLRPDRLLIAGPPVDVPSQAALMLSLVVNELATNAIKYGAWSTADGRIELAWLVSGEGKDRVLQMEWRESGGPPVAPPTHRGFGSNVLKFAVERGLKGTFLPAYEPAGFRCTWSFNLEGAN